MSTSIILLDYSFNANDVDMLVFESCFFIPSAIAWGRGWWEIKKHGRIIFLRQYFDKAQKNTAQLLSNSKLAYRLQSWFA